MLKFIFEHVCDHVYVYFLGIYECWDNVCYETVSLMIYHGL